MITNKTPDRIVELSQAIFAASAELEQIFRALTAEADTQMAAAALAFINERTTRGPLFASYAEAHETLLKAVVAASNIRELSKRSTTQRTDSTWLSGIVRGGQRPSDIRAVCARKTADSDNDGGGAEVAQTEGGNESETASRPGPKVRVERHPGSRWIEVHYAELPVNEWVAAGKDGLVAHDPSLDVVNVKLGELGMKPDEIALAFVEEPGPSLTRQ